MKKIFLLLLIIIFAIAGYFFIWNTNVSKIPSVPTDRLTYTGNGIIFSYPKTFGANVWRAVTRPPTVTIVPAGKDPIALGCPKLKESSMITESWLWRSNNIHYDFYQGEDVGAGSRYTSICYIFSWNTVNYVLNFEIHSHLGCVNSGCGAYCGTQFEQECRNFDLIRDVETPIEKMISSFQEVKSK